MVIALEVVNALVVTIDRSYRNAALRNEIKKLIIFLKSGFIYTSSYLSTNKCARFIKNTITYVFKH